MLQMWFLLCVGVNDDVYKDASAVTTQWSHRNQRGLSLTIIAENIS